jgi:hypothetical protein
MVERITRNSGRRFALTMLVILVFLIVLVLSMERHVSSVPNSGPLPNQQLQH